MNSYKTDDDERMAHTATHANRARAAIEAYSDALPELKDPWLAKVDVVLCEATEKLRALADEECRDRPGMVFVGRTYATANRRGSYDAALTEQEG